MISFFAIVAMFLTAFSIKSSGWTTLEWITRHWRYGYYWFIIGAVLFAVAGVLLLLAKNNPFIALWNNKTATIIISAVSFITLLFIFSNFALMYITAMVVALGFCIYMSFKMEEINKENIGKILLASFALGFVMFLIILLFSSSDGGCSACGGKGYIGAAENVGPFIDCPKC